LIRKAAEKSFERAVADRVTIALAADLEYATYATGKDENAQREKDLPFPSIATMECGAASRAEGQLHVLPIASRS
jgi:hypothetical protein